MASIIFNLSHFYTGRPIHVSPTPNLILHSHFVNRLLFLSPLFVVPLVAVRNCELMRGWRLYNASVSVTHSDALAQGALPWRSSNGVSRRLPPVESDTRMMAWWLLRTRTIWTVPPKFCFEAYSANKWCLIGVILLHKWFYLCVWLIKYRISEYVKDEIRTRKLVNLAVKLFRIKIYVGLTWKRCSLIKAKQGSSLPQCRITSNLNHENCETFGRAYFLWSDFLFFPR